MPGKVGVKIKAGRNLPVMDRGSDTTDAYVEIKLGNTTHKTEVCRKSLNPQFNTDWFRFEVDDAELQDEPLQIRLMDHDTYSANDAIGKVNISLNPLCLDTSGQTAHGKGTVLSGWIPVFDTMHGIRGEVNIIVKVDLFSDLNKFRQSSCGIPFFHSPCVPHGYRAQIIHGFVEELVVNDDPEYQWIDKIRTPRASNEARQAVFLQLSGQVQRKMGLKAINMGANAVIGYTQCFDLEGDVGVVVRGIGTAVTLIKDVSNSQNSAAPTTTENALIEERSMQYLQFLMGSNLNLNRKDTLSSAELYKFKVQKAHSTANLFDLKRDSSLDTEDDTAEIMLALMRQEDERGEKPVPKLKQQMRRFTRSSRNIFSEKYAAIKRKMGDSMESKSPDNMSMRSFGSLVSGGATSFVGAFAKSESSSSTRSSIYNGKQRKHSFKAKRRLSTKSKSGQRQSNPAHIMVRSVSDDSAMKKHEMPSFIAPRVSVISEYQESTRSSPDIFSNKSDSLRPCSPSNVPISVAKFGEVSDTTAESSSTTLSLSMSESSTSSSYEVQSIDYPHMSVEKETIQSKRVTAEKLAQLLKIIDEEESGNEKWIRPGQAGIDDDCIPELTSKSSHISILGDLKAFSHHLQGLMKPKKPSPPSVADALQTQFYQTPLNNLLLSPLSAENRKSYYSSQPEILVETASNELAIPNCPVSLPIAHSRSLINLKSAANGKSAANAKTAATTDDLPMSGTRLIPPYNYPPILQICPSTPTPTPSESDNSQLTPTDECVPRIVINEDTASNSPNLGSSVHSVVDIPTQSQSSSPNASPRCRSYTNCLNNLANSKPGKIDSNSLLAPLYCHISNSNLTTTNSTTHSASSPPSPSAAITSNCHRHHHRSLNELNVTNGQTDSPSMKRFASPASAAVVAAASNNATPAVVPSTTQPTNATGPQLGSRSTLSPSPSKMILTSAANNTSNNSNQPATVTQADNVSSTTTTSASTTSATTMVQKDVGEICRRSSDSDLSVTPKGNSICVASERLVAATAMMRLSQTVNSKNSTTANTESMDSMLEYPFLTMTKYPVGFILHLGATVAARSVKLLERVPNPDEPEVRDSWWTELRMEIRSHARALGCNVVLGYSESTTISDDVCVLSATGTAAVINMAYNRSVSQQDIYTTSKPNVGSGMSTSLEERDMLKEQRNGVATNDVKEPVSNISTSFGGSASAVTNNVVGKKYSQFPPLHVPKASANCNMCHVPYNLTSVPFNVKMKKCVICRKGRVPDVLLATLEVPEFMQVTGRGCFMQAQVVRAKKDLRSELNAKEISDGLPFLEYELHRVLINKLKAKGMNAIFGLRTQVAIGERMIALIATGTALFLTALPVPQVPRILAGNSWTDKQKLNELQKKLQETYERNQEIYQLKCIDPDLSLIGGEVNKPQQSDTDESDDEVIEIDLNCGNKDTCVLEVDDIEDLEIISLLMEPYPPEGFHVVNTQMVPGMVDMEAVKNLQMFTQIWRAKLDVGQQTINGFPKHFQRILQTIYFKLRTMIPCAICDLRFRLDLPESDQIQLLVTGMALGLGDVSKFKFQRRKQQQTLGSAGASTTNLKLAMTATPTNGTIVNTQEGQSNGSTPPVSVAGGNVGNKRPLQEEDYIFPLDEDQMVETPTPTSNLPPYGAHSFKLRKTSPSRATSKVNAAIRQRYFPLRDRHGIDITPLSFIPGGRIEKYLGNLNFFFIRESTSIRENGGISGFVHSFVTELLAVVRAHIAALGGNAMVSFYMNELILVDNQHKNQGQCLISIGGDAIYVSYYTDE